MSEPEAEAEVLPEPEGAAEVNPEVEMAEAEAVMEPVVEGEIEPEWEVEGEPAVSSEVEVWGAAEEESGLGTVEPEVAPELSDTEAATWVTLYSLCMLLIIFGDSLVIYSIVRKRVLRRKEANIYMLSLIFARTMIGFFVVPVRISAIFSEEYLGSVLCKLCHWSALGSLTTSIISMLAVAICKYKETLSRNKGILINVQPFAMKLPPDKQAAEKPKTAEKEEKIRPFLLRVAGFWMLGHLLALRVPFLFDLLLVERNGEMIWSCRLNLDYDVPNKAFIIVDFVCLFIVPLSIVLYCYIRILKLTKMTTVLRKTLHPKSSGSLIEKSIKDEKQTALMLTIVMALFIVCNLPPNVVKIYSLIDGKNGAAITNTTEQIVYLASYSNSWVNVLVYILFRDDIRQSLREMFACCCCFRKLNLSGASKVAPSPLPDSLDGKTDLSKVVDNSEDSENTVPPGHTKI